MSSITVLHPASITPEPTNSSRLKQSGMFWTVRGANAILALRCSHLNGRFEGYWEGRREALAA